MKKGVSLILLVITLLSGCSIFNPSVVTTNTPEDSIRKFPQITDVNRYSEVLNSADKNLPAIAHFPKEIPPEASNVKFAYQPRIMQGAMFLELLMTLPENQIYDLQDEYGDLEQYHYSDEISLTDISEPILYLISDKNDEGSGFDQNFSIYLISAEPAGKAPYIWNHGTMYGVGINKITLQVIYWLEYW